MCIPRWNDEALTVFMHAGVDWVQENVLGQGKQDNESAVEQAKDEQISGMDDPGLTSLNQVRACLIANHNC